MNNCEHNWEYIFGYRQTDFEAGTYIHWCKNCGTCSIQEIYDGRVTTSKTLEPTQNSQG